MPVPASFSPETSLLLSLLRDALGTSSAGAHSDATADAAADARAVDWNLFAAHVDRHRVAPFLVHRLSAEAKARLPAPVARQLLEAGLVTMQRARVRTETLVRLARCLDAAAIPVTSVKGPVLAQRLYGAPGARHAGDLDLLVHADDVTRADQALRAAGLQRTLPEFALTPAQDRLFRRMRREYGYVDPATGVKVELMWRLHDVGSGDAEHEETEVVELAGYPIRALGSEAEALYLILHGARHGWTRLVWLVDVAMLLQGDTVCWAPVARRAERAGERRSFEQTMRLARELLGAGQHVTRHAALHDLAGGRPSAAVRALVDHVRRHVDDPHFLARGDDASVRHLADRVRRHDRWTARWQEVRQLLLDHRDLATVALPERWLALYHLLRPFTWLRRRAHRLLRHA